MAIGNGVRSQDTVRLLAAVQGHADGQMLTWAWIKRNWGILNKRYGDGGFAFTRLIQFCRDFNTEEMLNEVTAFFEAHPVPAAQRELTGAKEEIGAAIVWSSKNAPA